MSIFSSPISKNTNYFLFLSLQEQGGVSSISETDRPVICAQKMIRDFANRLISRLDPEKYSVQKKRLETIAACSLSADQNHLKTVLANEKNFSRKREIEKSLYESLISPYELKLGRILSTLPEIRGIDPPPIFPNIGSIRGECEREIDIESHLGLYFEQSLQCIRDGNIDGAIVLCRYIHDAHLRKMTLGEIVDQLIQEKDFDAALECIRSFPRLNLEFQESLFRKVGSGCIKAGKTEKAIEMIENSISLPDVKNLLLLEISFSFFVQKDTKKALQYMNFISSKEIQKGYFSHICASYCSNQNELKELENFNRSVIPSFLQDQFFLCLVPYLIQKELFDTAKSIAKEMKNPHLRSQAFRSIGFGYIQERDDFDQAAAMICLVSSELLFSPSFEMFLNAVLRRDGVEGAVNLIRTYFSNRMTPSILSSFLGQIDSRDVREELEKRLNDFLF